MQQWKNEKGQSHSTSFTKKTSCGPKMGHYKETEVKSMLRVMYLELVRG